MESYANCEFFFGRRTLLSRYCTLAAIGTAVRFPDIVRRVPESRAVL